MRRIKCFLALTGIVLGVVAVNADSINFGGSWPGTAEVIAATEAQGAFGQDTAHASGLAQTFSVASAFSAQSIYLVYENDADSNVNWNVTVTIFEVADVDAVNLVAGTTLYTDTFTFPAVGPSDTIARIDLDTPLALAASVGTAGYAIQFAGGGDPGWEWLRTTSATGDDVYAGGKAYEDGVEKSSGTKDYTLAILSIPEPETPGMLTVSAAKDLSNPDILAYNLGHFYEGSNTHDWWRYSGVNGARIFISPATLESNDDISGWGDGVSDQSSFLSRRSALRADPLNLSYINWTYFNDRYENKLFGSSSSGNRFTVNHALTKLRELDIDILVQATAKESHLIITNSSDWAGKWELWQHYYAQAFYLGRHFDVHRFQMFNEPNHPNAGGLTKENWLMRLQLASDAIQSALADVNSTYGKSLEPLVYGPVNSGGADFYSGSGWGDYMVANRHVDFLGVTDTNYWVVHRYDYHEYNSTPASFENHHSSLRSALNADMNPEDRFPTSLSEFNVHTAGEFDTMPDTLDYPAKYTRLGGIGAQLADDFLKEFYCFKFGQANRSGGTYPVGKNGTHYVQNSAPYEYGGATKAAEVWRLFNKALKPGGEQKKFDLDGDQNPDDDLAIRATYVPESGNYYVFIANEGSGTNIIIDTSAWGIPAGSRFQLEEVSEDRYGIVRTWNTVSADGTLFDGTDNIFHQPNNTVRLFTIPGKALEPEEIIAATEDAMVVDGANAAVKYGSATTLTVGNDAASADNRKTAFIKFHLPYFYPPDIQMAVLSLTGKNAAASAANQAHVYGLDDDSWSAGTLTWANAPNLLKGQAAGNLIADRVVDGQGESAYIQGQLVFTSTNDKERMIDVTSFLKGQADRDVSFLISQDPRWDVALPSLAVGDTQADELVIKSSESGSGPQLKIVRLKDTDGDGISDEAENTVFMTNDGLPDSDGDGQWDGEEIFAGSDPKDPDSRFVIPDYAALGDGSFTVEWSSLEARTYSLERSLSLTSGDWNEIHSAAGTGGTMSYNDSPGTTNAFYRLRVY